MWACESVFYQIYPLGFCGAPFENDGKLEHRILKVTTGFPISKNWGRMRSIFRRCSSQTLTDTIPEIIEKWIADWALMRILHRSAKICIKKASALCWTACLIMPEGAFSPFRTW